MEALCADFLRWLDFSEDELKTLAPDFKNTVDVLGISREELVQAREVWIPQHWDIRLKGVRLCVGAYIRELIHITNIPQYKARGAKVVYGISPSVPTAYQVIKNIGREDVYVGLPDFILVVTLNTFFKKLSTLNRDQYMNEQCRHCVLNRTRLNAAMESFLPAPDLIWSWGFYCDEAPKTEELLDCLTEGHWNYVISRMPHDALLGEAEDTNPDRVRYLASQLRDAYARVEETTGIRVDEQSLRSAFEDARRYMLKLDKLYRLVSDGDPQPIGGNELALFGVTGTIPFNSGLQPLEKALDCMLEEVEELSRGGNGILPKGSPKLGCYFTPFCVPWVDREFRKNGICIAFSSQCAFSTEQLSKLRSSDPFEMVAEHWLRNANTVNMGRQVELLSGLVSEYNVDGMLYGFFSFDRYLGANQQMMVRMVEERSGMQCFYIEGDFWDDRNYSQEDRAGRIESISSFLKLQKILTQTD